MHAPTATHSAKRWRADAAHRTQRRPPLHPPHPPTTHLPTRTSPLQRRPRRAVTRTGCPSASGGRGRTCARWLAPPPEAYLRKWREREVGGEGGGGGGGSGARGRWEGEGGGAGRRTRGTADDASAANARGRHAAQGVEPRGITRPPRRPSGRPSSRGWSRGHVGSAPPSLRTSTTGMEGRRRPRAPPRE